MGNVQPVQPHLLAMIRRELSAVDADVASSQPTRRARWTSAAEWLERQQLEALQAAAAAMLGGDYPEAYVQAARARALHAVDVEDGRGGETVDVEPVGPYADLDPVDRALREAEDEPGMLRFG